MPTEILHPTGAQLAAEARQALIDLRAGKKISPYERRLLIVAYRHWAEQENDPKRKSLLEGVANAFEAILRRKAN